MAGLPYGYTYKDGRICVDEGQAEQVRTLFSSFIAGLSYEMSARSAGLKSHPTQVKKMLLNPCYCGAQGFEPIIDPLLFANAGREQIRRANTKVWHRGKRVGQPIPVGVCFRMGDGDDVPDDPFEQAAYIYSLIVTEEQDGSDSE